MTWSRVPVAAPSADAATRPRREPSDAAYAHENMRHVLGGLAQAKDQHGQATETNAA